MKLLISSLSVVAAIAFMSGCATTNTVPANAPSLRLAQAQERFYDSLVTLPVQFPAGEYKPVFADHEGIYYRAPALLEMTNAANPNPRGTFARVGGIFVPYASARDHRQMGWVEESSHSPNSGVIWMNDHTPIRLFRVSSALDYLTVVPATHPHSSLTAPNSEVALRN